MSDTETLPLKGEKQARQKGLTGDVIADKPDPLVVERAREYARHLDAIDNSKDKAEKAYAELQQAFTRSKRQRKVTVTTEWNSWTFWSDTTTKVKKKKETPVR